MNSNSILRLSAALVLACPAFAGDAIAVTFGGDVYRFTNIPTASVLLGNSGFVSLGALARNADDHYIASSGGSTVANAKLIEINQQTGAGTLLASMSTVGDVRGLAFDTDDSLLAIVHTTTCSLYRIDPVTYVATFIGATGLTNVQALAVSPQGVVYAWDSGTTSTNGKGLVTLSEATGAPSDVNTAVGGDTTIQTLGFDTAGQLYGLRNELYRINEVIGSVTQVGSTQTNDYRGFEFVESMNYRDGALAVRGDGDVARLNTSNGVAATIATHSGIQFNALARDPTTGEFVASIGFAGTARYIVDPDTGAIANSGAGPLDGVRAMEFDPSGGLWEISHDGVNPDKLWHTPDGSGAPQFVASTGCDDIRALTITPFGAFLLAWDAVKGLVKINPTNGLATDVNASVNGHAFESLAFDPSGHLFAANDSFGIDGLYEIDAATGAATLLTVLSNGDYRGVSYFSRFPFPTPSTYCTAQTNSQGCAPALSFASPYVPSASIDHGFTVTAFPVLFGKAGLFFYGLSGRAAAPFLGGTLCVNTPVTRTPVQTSGGANVNCGGNFTFDFNAYIALGTDPRLVGGAVVNGQFWSRDPAAASTTNLSNAIEFTIAP